MKKIVSYSLMILFFCPLMSQKPILIYKDCFKDYFCFDNESDLFEFDKKLNFNFCSPESLLDTVPKNCCFFNGDFKFINTFSDYHSNNTVVRSEMIGKYENGIKNGRFIYYKFDIESRKHDTILSSILYCDYSNGKRNGDCVFIQYHNSDKLKRNKRKRVYYPIVIHVISFKNDSKVGVSYYWELNLRKKNLEIVKNNFEVFENDESINFSKQIDYYQPKVIEKKKNKTYPRHKLKRK